MFDSGILVKDLIDALQTEVDIALQIPDETYISWLNSLQHILYTEVIKEQNELVVGTDVGGKIDIEAQTVPDGESPVRFEDVHAVYALVDTQEIQLIKSTVASGPIFPNSYYKIGNQIGVNKKAFYGQLMLYKIVYFVKPALVKIEDYNVKRVMVPVEFIDLVKAKLRGEAYKLANEGELSAMWLNDYNVLLETFKAWIADKAPNFGL